MVVNCIPSAFAVGSVVDRRFVSWGLRGGCTLEAKQSLREFWNSFQVGKQQFVDPVLASVGVSCACWFVSRVHCGTRSEACYPC